MNIPSSIECAALFGSFVRGDFDVQSDKDLLLIGPEQSRDSCVRYDFGTNVSPSYYSWDEFFYMASAGSPFVQHLKQESILLRDLDGRFKAALESFLPCTNHAFRLCENRQLLGLTHFACETPGVIAWALDVLAVGIRNFAILKNAERGCFIFSFAELMSGLAIEHGLSADELDSLLALRGAKFEYRNGRHTASNSALLRTTRGIAISLGALSPESISQPISLANSVLPRDDGEPWYITLRRLEGAYRALQDHGRDGGPAIRARVNWLVSHPTRYPSLGSYPVRELESLVMACSQSMP
jgi:hypothetical protein